MVSGSILTPAKRQFARVCRDIVALLRFIHDEVLGGDRAVSTMVGTMLWGSSCDIKSRDHLKGSVDSALEILLGGGSDSLFPGTRGTTMPLEDRLLQLLSTALPSQCAPAHIAESQKWLLGETEGFLSQLESLGMRDNGRLGMSKTSGASESMEGGRPGDRLIEFVKQLPIHTATHRRRQLLCAARELIRNEHMYAATTAVAASSSVAAQSLLQRPQGRLTLAGQSLTEAHPTDTTMSPLGDAADGDDLDASSSNEGFFTLPACRVTVCAQELVKLAQTALQEATRTGVPTPSARALLLTARDVFDLYRAVAPVVHARQIQSAPRLPMLVHNDCLYLAHHALFIAHEHRQGLPALLRPVATMVDLVPPLRRMAEDSYAQQMQQQQQELLQAIAPFDKCMASWCHGSRRDAAASTSSVLADDASALSSNEEGERALKQAVRLLEHLAVAWADILPQSIFRHAIGRLAELVASNVLEGVLSLQQITTEQASTLQYVLSLLLDVEGRLASKNVVLADMSLPWAALSQAALLIAEHRSIAGAQMLINDPVKLKELGPERSQKLMQILFENT